MRNIKILILAALGIFAGAMVSTAEKVVILHTNDTHSSIEPDEHGVGGVLQRKAIVDSVRRADKHVLLIDAGDVVQGSLYFNYFNGDVEYPLMNMFNYDVRILGNHEFDNGIEDLAKYWKQVNAARLSANYDFSNTPARGLFEPYIIKKVAGKRIGIMGLNVDPANLIGSSNTGDLKFHDVIETANRTAAMLKHDKKCDMVVAVTHIGYVPENGKTTDVDLAEQSRDIDMIIGGHSHTLITPGSTKYPDRIKNLDGRDVLVVQTGKYGRYIGRIEFDTERLKDGAEAYDYSLIPVTDRFDAAQLDPKMAAFLVPYKHVVDSVNANVIGRSLQMLDSDARTGRYPNWAADFARNYGIQKRDSLGLANAMPIIGIMNVGGIRQNLPQGDVTEGRILATFPFSNKITLLEVTGADLIKDMQMAAGKGGEGISENVRVVLGPDGKSVARVVVDGREVTPDAKYLVSTIDYLAQGNDDFAGLANGRVVWTDDVDVKAPLIGYIKNLTRLGLPINPDPTSRFVEGVVIP